MIDNALMNESESNKYSSSKWSLITIMGLN